MNRCMTRDSKLSHMLQSFHINLKWQNSVIERFLSRHCERYNIFACKELYGDSLTEWQTSLTQFKEWFRINYYNKMWVYLKCFWVLRNFDCNWYHHLLIIFFKSNNLKGHRRAEPAIRYHIRYTALPDKIILENENYIFKP